MNGKFLYTLLFVFLIVFVSCSNNNNNEVEKLSNNVEKPEYVIVIHGGAGNITRERIPKEHEAEYIAKLQEAMDKGKKVLKSGGTALDAVIETIKILEDCPLFNAGKGAVFTNNGTNEMDASIMDGSNLNAGAITGIQLIKNPITLARRVMDSSKHVMLSGKGALDFAIDQGFEMVDSGYFYTDERWNGLQKVLEREKSDKFGTVGCVVLDKYGNLAAGTSTGGMTNKKYGRIGDSPIIGAGTYANNNTCAVSATGWGEYFIRYTIAHDISALMEYKSMNLEQAADIVINTKLEQSGGYGGVIAVDKNGNIAMPFNTNGMFRAYSKSTGDEGIFIFKDTIQ